jgi:putative ABC transport system ATP-binding protein
MAAYARRIVRFVDGLVASDIRNEHPAGLRDNAIAAELR